MAEFDRLLIFRALRPDRLTAAMRNFVTNTLGKEYTISLPFNLEASLQVVLYKLQQKLVTLDGTPRLYQGITLYLYIHTGR